MCHLISFAQLTITDVTTTESTCLENGTAIVTASGSSGYIYSITAGPKLFPPQNSSLFETLPPGFYTFTVTDDVGDVATEIAEVTGNYQLMDPILSQTGYSCESSNDGSITVDVTTGLGPYEYALISPSVEERPFQSSPLFEDLILGDYTVQTKDACGNIQTRMITVDGWTDPITRWANNSGITKICGLPQEYQLSLYWGGGTITEADSLIFRVYDAATDMLLALDTLVSGTSPMFTVPAPTDMDQGYKIENYDPVCDRIKATIFMDLDEPILTPTLTPVENSCDLYDVTLNTNNRKNKEHCDATIWSITDTADGTVIETATTSNRNPASNNYNYIFQDIPAGNYDACYENCCGEKFCTNFTLEAQDKLLSYSIRPSRACISGTSQIAINAENFSLPYDLIFESGPSTITTPAGTYTNNFNPEDIIITQSTGSNIYFQYSNLGVGTYVFRVEDACDDIETLMVEITEDDLRTYDFNVEIIPGCVTGHKVIVTWEDNTDGAWSPDILIDGVQVNGNEQFLGGQIIEYANLSSGNLLVEIEARGIGVPMFDNCPQNLSFSGVIEPYEQPEIAVMSAYQCDDASSVILSEGIKGVSPYTFELSQGGSVIATQIDNGVFEVPNSGIFDLRLIDACQNSIDGSESAGELSMPVITSVPVCNVSDELTSITLTTPDIYGITYEWLDPNNVSIGTTPELTIDPFFASDEGLYTLNISLTDVPECVTSTSTIQLDNDVCGILPIELVHFTAKAEKEDVHITWQTASEINNDYFEVQRSKNGIKWEMIQKVSGAINSSRTISYEWIDKKPLAAISYYRLKQVDLDGKYANSKIEVVQLSTISTNDIIMPSILSSNESFTITSTTQVRNIIIYNIHGQVIINLGNIEPNQTIQSTLDDVGNGLYFVNFQVGNENITRKIVIR